MARHADFYPLVQPFVPGCPSMTVDLALNRAAHEFCVESRAWEEAIDALILQSGVSLYELSVGAGVVVVCVQAVTVREHDLAPIKRARDMNRVEIHGTPYAFAFDEADNAPTVIVSPTPSDEDNGVEVTPSCTLAPAFNARTLPDVLARRYMDAIAEGAKFHLKTMTGTPWFDPGGADLASSIFAQRKAEARIQREGGFVAGSMRTTVRAFGD